MTVQLSMCMVPMHSCNMQLSCCYSVAKLIISNNCLLIVSFPQTVSSTKVGMVTVVSAVHGFCNILASCQVLSYLLLNKPMKGTYSYQIDTQTELRHLPLNT